MRIIDKNKDFYDYFSYIYGIDNLVTFDRRGSTVITDEMLYNSYEDRRATNYGNSTFHILEVGYTQYLLRLDNIYTKKVAGFQFNQIDLSSATLSIDMVFTGQKHFSKVPLSLYYVDTYYWNFWHTPRDKREKCRSLNIEELIKEEYEIKLPILAQTMFTKVLDGDILWKELSTYISSLNNDKDVSIDMTEKQKAETHGFDKFSFRHPVK